MPEYRKVSAAELAELLTGGDEVAANAAIPEPRITTSTPTATQNSAAPDPFGLTPLEFESAVDFHETFWPEFKLNDWQRATLNQLSGFADGTHREDPLPFSDAAPLLYQLVAANGSGKSAIIVARYVLWFVVSATKNKAIVTSASFDQLKRMTFHAIHAAAEEVNAQLGEPIFKCSEVRVDCVITRGFVQGFATDKPGRAEGFHPDPGGKMAIVIDEAKTITDEMFAAFTKFSGFCTWLEVSSPGPALGHFYERTMQATGFANIVRESQQDPIKLNEVYYRKVTAFQNSHLTKAHIENVVRTHGKDSPQYRSTILAEFTSLEDGAVIKTERCNYPAPAYGVYGMGLHAGLDLSLGGDETCLSVWDENRRKAQQICHISDPEKLRDWAIGWFVHYGLTPDKITADGGGIGKAVIQMIRNAGWEIHSINNEQPAVWKKDFLNRGMEMYWILLRLIEEKVLILPHDDGLLMRQLTTRQAVYRGGKLKLQSKAELAKSPDRSDAMALAFARIDLAEVLLVHDKLKLESQRSEPIKSDGVVTLEQLQGFLDWRAAKTAAQRTHEHSHRGFLTYAPGNRTASNFSNYYKRRAA